MTFRLGILIGLACGVLLTLLASKQRNSAQPDNPRADENAKWDKRIDELHSFYSEEKANSRLGNRR